MQVLELDIWGKQCWVIGNPGVLNLSLTGLFCSSKYPAGIVLKSYDLAHSMREEGVPVICGFQTFLEKDLLAILLKGKNPLVVCEARGLWEYRVPAIWKEAIQQGRLCIISPFEDAPRVTRENALIRNRLVAELAERVIVLHAREGGMLAGLIDTWKRGGKSLYMLGEWPKFYPSISPAEKIQPTRAITRQRAIDLRHHKTPEEILLWQYLRAKRAGVKFRQQHPITPYIVDFCSIEIKLVIEVDGKQHKRRERYDQQRTAYLNKKGYTVLRFWNDEINNDLQRVLQDIREAVTDRL